jgi:hypothetical protein
MTGMDVPRAPHPDGSLNKTARMKIRHYRQIYADRSDPIVFLPITIRTSGRVYEDFVWFVFLTQTSIEAGVDKLSVNKKKRQFFHVSGLLFIINIKC